LQEHAAANSSDGSFRTPRGPRKKRCRRFSLNGRDVRGSRAKRGLQRRDSASQPFRDRDGALGFGLPNQQFVALGIVGVAPGNFPLEILSGCRREIDRWNVTAVSFTRSHGTLLGGISGPNPSWRSGDRRARAVGAFCVTGQAEFEAPQIHGICMAKLAQPRVEPADNVARESAG
jgi:hypothetical protein